jgi:endonuclease-8
VLPTRAVGETRDLPAVVDLAERMLQANKDRWNRSTTGNLRPGSTTWVYGRRGRPCRRCGTRLLGGELGRLEGQERVVTWCPRCQS